MHLINQRLLQLLCEQMSDSDVHIDDTAAEIDAIEPPKSYCLDLMETELGVLRKAINNF